jgi:hypothetical protein
VASLRIGSDFMKVYVIGPRNRDFPHVPGDPALDISRASASLLIAEKFEFKRKTRSAGAVTDP